MFLESQKEEEGASKASTNLSASSLLASLVLLEIPYNMALDLTLRQLMDVITDVTDRREKANNGE